MQNLSVLGIVIALGSGVAVGIQSTLLSSIGEAIGPVRTSLVINVTGGLLAGGIVLLVMLVQGGAQLEFNRSTLLYSVISVGIGLVVLAGLAFAYPRTGIAAGIAALFFGQMLIGVIVDALGLSAGGAAAFDLRRASGLLVMSVAVFLLAKGQ